MSPIYICVLIVTTALGFAAEANPILLRKKDGRAYVQPDKVSAILLASFLILVSGFRYRVGTDYMAYYRWVVSDASKVLNNIIWFREGGFSLLAFLSRVIYNHGQTLIFFSAVITIGLYCRTIYKYHDMFLVSMLLYILMGEWQGSFNGIRQYLAAAIVFTGHRYILSRDWLKYGLVVLAASLFHTTAIIMIVPFFIFTRKADIRQLVVLAIGSVIIRFSYDLIFSIIGNYKGKVMNVLGDSYLTNSVSIYRILVAFIPVLIYVFLCRKINHTKEQNFYVNAFFFHAFSMFAGMGSTYFGRIGIYTSAVPIIGYGFLFQLIDDERTRRVTIYAAMVMFLLYWIYSIKAGGLGNFQWIFNNL